MLAENDFIPSFSLESSDGKVYSDKDFYGKYTVLYFYPRDNTSGCTAEALSINCLYDEFSKLDVNIVGVSCDSISSHAKFKENHNLQYVLLSDPQHLLCESCGAWGEKSMYGKKYMGIIRCTFVFDEKGQVKKVYSKVKTKTHGSDLLKYLSSR